MFDLPRLKNLPFAKLFVFGCLFLPLTVFSQTAEGWKWRFDAKGATYSSPYVGKNNVYVYNAEHFVFALEMQTGREKWRYKLRPETWLDERGEAADKLILLERFESSSKSKLVADRVVGLDAATGKEIWQKDFGGSDIDGMHISGSLIYLNVENFGLAVLDAASGAVKWQSDACPDVIGTPVVNGKSIYVECFGGKIYAIDTDSGKFQWKFGSRGEIPANFVFSKDSVFYKHSEKREAENLFALDKASGRERWTLPASNSYPEQMTADNLFLTTALKGAPMSAVNAVSGKILWQIDGAGELPVQESSSEEERTPNLSLPSFSGGMFYFGTDDGTLLAVRSSDGKVVWKTKISEQRIKSPEIIGSRGFTIIVENETYYLAATNLLNGKLSWRMRLYGSAYELVRKDNLLFFESDDYKINAVAPLEVEKLARLKKNLGSLPAVPQTIISRGGMGSGGGDMRTGVQDDVQAEIFGGTAFVTVSRKTGSVFYAIDLLTGKRKVLVEHAPEQLIKPQISGGIAYYLGSDFRSKHTLYAFDTAAGKMLWQAETAGSNATSPLAVSEKYIAYVSNHAVLYVYNLDGKQVLKQGLSLTTSFNQSNNSKQLVVIGGETIYFTEGNSLYSYDLAVGKANWTTDFSRRIGNVALGLSDVYVGSDDENLYALDKKSGAKKWKVNVQGNLPYFANNVYFNDAIVYYVSEARFKNLLQAYDAASGKLLWERNVGSSEIQFGGGSIFTDAASRTFNGQTGKSVFYDNILEIKKLLLVDASSDNIVLGRDFSDRTNKLKIKAVDRKNNNKIFWETDFAGAEPKSN